MNEQENIRVIQDMFAAQKRCDIEAVLSSLTEDVEWRGSVDVLGARALKGRDEVGKFLSSISDGVEIEDSEIQDYIAQRDKVVVLGREKFRVKATGRTGENHFAIVFTLRDGRIERCHAYDDTAASLAAFGE